MRHFSDMMGWRAHEPSRTEGIAATAGAPHAPAGGEDSPAPAAAPLSLRPIGLPWRPIPTTGSGHAMIAVSRVLRANVFDNRGRAAGEITDLSIDKSTGRVTFAIVSFGNFFGLRTRFHPIPWALLRYDTRRDAYVTPLTVSELDAAPSLTPDDLEVFGAGDRAWRDRLAAYYNPLLQLGAL
jgi:sporulation protein YlmC with PRC-barrel domain